MIGILAFQGNVAEHKAVLTELGHRAREVRAVGDLDGLTHLIIPGGESTVMGRFLVMWGLDDPIEARAKAGDLAIFGTCAGAILLAKKALGKNAPVTLGLIDIDADRNAYGTKADSFEAELQVKGIPGSVDVAFIRAPAFSRVGKTVDVLAEHGGQPVIVKQGRILASTCHPEARGETAVHRMFLKL